MTNETKATYSEVVSSPPSLYSRTTVRQTGNDNLNSQQGTAFTLKQNDTVDDTNVNNNKDNNTSSDGFTPVVRKRKKIHFIGKSNNNNIKAVNSKHLSMFLSRLHSTCSEDDVLHFLSNSLSDKASDIKCIKLKTKHDTYSSFKIDLLSQGNVDIYDPELWPHGTLVRRFFQPKKQRTENK
jgi:hypothetical protein